MPFNLESQGAQKDQFVVGLAALLLKDVNAEINAESIQAVVDASKNTVPAYYPTLFASFIEKAGGLDKYTAGPSAGAAPVAGGAAPAAAAEAAPVKEEKVEEVDALDGGMGLFGGAAY